MPRTSPVVQARLTELQDAVIEAVGLIERGLPYEGVMLLRRHVDMPAPRIWCEARRTRAPHAAHDGPEAA